MNDPPSTVDCLATFENDSPILCARTDSFDEYKKVGQVF